MDFWHLYFLYRPYNNQIYGLNPWTHVEIDMSENTDEQLEFRNLPVLLTEWKKIQEERQTLIEEKKKINERIREQEKRAEAMQGKIMKHNCIGAVDLKSSQARALFKRRVIKTPIGQKDLKKYLVEHLKSDEEAKKLLAFLDTKRDTIIRESLVYEKNPDAE